MSSTERVLNADPRLRIARKIAEQHLGSDAIGKELYEEVCLGERSITDFFGALKEKVKDPKLSHLISEVEASAAPETDSR